jgi:hypothetical protein
LVFDWRHDRHQKQLLRDLEVAGVVSSELLMASVEGDATHRWPTSPPLQSLAFEARGEQSVALGVGMAGGAHWSGSIETLAEPLALRFDYACRSTEEPEFLGSTFLLAPEASSARLQVTDLAGCALESLLENLRIVADPPVKTNSVLTARWRFTIRYTVEV